MRESVTVIIIIGCDVCGMATEERQRGGPTMLLCAHFTHGGLGWVVET